MGLVQRIFPRAAPTVSMPSTALVILEATPQSTPRPTLQATLETTLVAVAQPTSEPEPAARYVVRDGGIIVGLAHEPVTAPHAETHALDLLHFLIQDERFEGQTATVGVLKRYYLDACRADGVRPFKWIGVLRHLNRFLKALYGPAYKKSYGYARGRRRRVYRIPTLEEFQEARERLAEAVAGG